MTPDLVIPRFAASCCEEVLPSLLLLPLRWYCPKQRELLCHVRRHVAHGFVLNISKVPIPTPAPAPTVPC